MAESNARKIHETRSVTEKDMCLRRMTLNHKAPIILPGVGTLNPKAPIILSGVGGRIVAHYEETRWVYSDEGIEYGNSGKNRNTRL